MGPNPFFQNFAEIIDRRKLNPNPIKQKTHHQNKTTRDHGMRLLLVRLGRSLTRKSTVNRLIPQTRARARRCQKGQAREISHLSGVNKSFHEISTWPGTSTSALKLPQVLQGIWKQLPPKRTISYLYTLFSPTHPKPLFPQNGCQGIACISPLPLL